MSWQLACTNTNTVGYRMMITLFLTPWTTTKQREIRQFTVMERVKEQNQNPKQIHPKNTAESDDWHRRDVGHLLITKRTEL